MKRTLLFSLASLCLISVQAQTEQTLIKDYLQKNATKWSLQSEDFNGIEITSTATSKAPGAKHYFVRQTFNGIPVVNGIGTVTLKNNAVIHVSERFQNLPEQFLVQTVSTPNFAVQSATKHLGLDYEITPLIASNTAIQSYKFEKGNFSKTAIPVRLMIQITDEVPELVWDLSIYPTNENHWWSLRIAATTGELRFKNDWVASCNFDACEEAAHEHQLSSIPSTLMPPPPGADQYMVYALPVESPNHGNRSLLINPSDPTYSPYGWHDTDGMMGDEYTITRGNNVYASDDIDDDDIPG